jgi:orotate phosphoribosyltransferase
MNQGLTVDGTQTRMRLADLLIETKSFRMSDEPTFPLASGVLSQFYIDCKIALSFPEVRELVGQGMLRSAISANAFAVGGLIIGAYPIAIAVSDVAFRETGHVLRAFVIRKEPKKHGLKKCVEGIDPAPGQRVVIVDDVITSGKSTIEAIKKVRDEGFEVVKALAFVDRQEQNGRQAIEEQGISFEALCTLSQLKERHRAMASSK